MDEFQEIILKSEQLFMRYGVKSITMDDLCKDMGISKKTLYKYVSDKAELIKKVIENHQCAEKEFVKELTLTANDAVQELVLISERVAQMLQNLNPTLLYDLEKYYRESWELMNDFQRNVIASSIRENILRGQKEGLYRMDINIDIIPRLYVGMVHACTDPALFPYPPFHPVNTYPKVIEYHLHAITTPRGLEMFRSYLNT